jgi:hypothetical protein
MPSRYATPPPNETQAQQRLDELLAQLAANPNDPVWRALVESQIAAIRSGQFQAAAGIAPEPPKIPTSGALPFDWHALIPFTPEHSRVYADAYSFQPASGPPLPWHQLILQSPTEMMRARGAVPRNIAAFVNYISQLLGQEQPPTPALTTPQYRRRDIENLP